MSRFLHFLSELFRRKVVRLLCAYVAIIWLLAQGFASLFPVLGLPDWLLRAFIVAGVAAIPVVAFLSWKYDLIPPQLVRDSQDLTDTHPVLSWARRRHNSSNAGHLLLGWQATDGLREMRFDTPVSIGREPGNDVELSNEYVSRHHAVLWAEDSQWHIRDLDSTNGTFVDQTRVSGTSALPLSCEIRFHLSGPAVAVRIEKPTETLVRTDVSG